MCQKLRLDWIKTAVGIHGDPSVFKLFRRRGHAGRGVYEQLRTIIGVEGRVEDAALTDDDGEPTDLEWLTAQLSLASEEETRGYLDDFAACKLIDRDAWKDRGIVAMPSFLKYHEEILRRRANGEFGGLGGRPKNPLRNPPENPPRNPRKTREERSRVEKRGVEESGEEAPPVLPLEEAPEEPTAQVASAEPSRGADPAPTLRALPANAPGADQVPRPPRPAPGFEELAKHNAACRDFWGARWTFHPPNLRDVWNAIYALYPGALTKLTELPDGRELETMREACASYPDPRFWYEAGLTAIADEWLMGDRDGTVKLTPAYFWGPRDTPGGNAKNLVMKVNARRARPPDPAQTLAVRKRLTKGVPLGGDPDERDPNDPFAETGGTAHGS